MFTVSIDTVYDDEKAERRTPGVLLLAIFMEWFWAPFFCRDAILTAKKTPFQQMFAFSDPGW